MENRAVLFSTYLFIYVFSYFSSSPLAASPDETFLIREPRDSEETWGISGCFRIPMKNTRFRYVHANVSSSVFGGGRPHTGLQDCEKFSRRVGNTIRRYIAGTCRVYRNGRRLTSTLVHTRTETYTRTCINTHDEDIAFARAHTILYCTRGPHLRKEALILEIPFSILLEYRLKIKYQ